jgi:hypothetical protein
MNVHQKLSPAQKAWETRRARIEGRAIVEQAKAKVAVEEAKPSPLSDARMVEIELDRSDVGCGRRRYIVLDIGDWTVRLFSAASLIAIDVPRIEFERKAKPARHNAKTVAAIIRRNMALCDRVNDKAQAVVMFDGGDAAKRALELLS